MSRILPIVLASVTVAASAITPADSTRGEQLFTSLSCIQCHSLNGNGGHLAADLGRRLDRNFTPAMLAGTMWNHAPTMWAAMDQRGIRAGDVTEQAAADLFAFFYSARFFDMPGDASRGKALFSVRHCAECHGLTTPKIPGAKPVSQWESLGQPIVLANAMWNHGVNMRAEFARRKIPWPKLTAQDLADLLVYLRNLPSTRNSTVHFYTGSAANGETLFQGKGCVTCHSAKLALPPLLKRKTLTEIAVEMWNHQPLMAQVPPLLSEQEMRDLVSYLWAQEFFADSGNPAAGKRVLIAKHCVICHSDPASGAPSLTSGGRSYSAVTMVSALWRHGPAMLRQMEARNITWPRFERQEMSNLIAYLNTTKGKE